MVSSFQPWPALSLICHLTAPCRHVSTLTQVLPSGAATGLVILRTATGWQHRAISEAHHWPSQGWLNLSFSQCLQNQSFHPFLGGTHLLLKLPIRGVRATTRTIPLGTEGELLTVFALFQATTCPSSQDAHTIAGFAT